MWAPEENRQLKELRERLGMAARLESNIENLGSAKSCRSANGSAATIAASETFYVGNRVRVMRGRKFHNFGAGDAGTVLRVDAEGGVCTVAFDERAEPLQVAMRHLEAETSRRQPRIAAVAVESAGQLWESSANEDQANLEQMNGVIGTTTAESGEQRSQQLEANSEIPAAAAIGPAWTRGELEKPADVRDMGGWSNPVYSMEQQQRLHVDDPGNASKVEFPSVASSALSAALTAVGTLEPRPAPGATGETPSLTLLPGESDPRRIRMADSGTGSSAGCMRRSASQPAAQHRLLETVPRTVVQASGVLGAPCIATEALWQQDAASTSCGAERLPFRTLSGADLGTTLSSTLPSARLPPAPLLLDSTSAHCDPAVSSAIAGTCNDAAECCAERTAEWRDPLQKEAAEIRRVADAAAAAEYRREAALFIEQHGANTAAREEAEALAEAVQASAHATATATATAMVEVASLRVEVSELQTLLSKEAEQRTTSVRELERSLEQLRAKQERSSTDTDEAIKAEQKRLSRKQAELVSLCLSLQKDQAQELHADADDGADAAIDWEHWEQRLATLDRGLEVAMRSQERATEQLRSLEVFSASSMEERRLFEERMAALEASATASNTILGTLDTIEHTHADDRMAREMMEAQLEHTEKRVMELEKRLLEVDSGVLLGAERLEAISARVDALAGSLALKADREATPAAAGRIDSLASRIDTLVMDLAAKAERETPSVALASAQVVEALSLRLDRLTEMLGVEVARVEALHHEGMQESAAVVTKVVQAAEQREQEQLHRLGAEAERHAAELQDAAAEVERRASEAIKIGQRAREALEAHCEITNDKHNAVEALHARIDAVGEGLAVEARLREEAIQRVEAQCRQAREDAANAAPAAAAAATSAAGVNASAMERQLKAVLTEVRSDADRAETGRREESQRRREAELALQRLRGELDVLREELMRRSAMAPMASSPSAIEAASISELPQSGNLRAAATPAGPEVAPPVTHSVTPVTTTPPAPPPRVTRFSSGPPRERPQQSTAEVFRWPSPPLRSQQATSPPREKTAVPVLVESGISPRQAASPEPLARWATTASAATHAAPVVALPRVQSQGAPRATTPPQPGRALALPAAPATSAPAAAAAPAAAEHRPTAMAAMKCDFCGNIFMQDAVFCRRCGAKRCLVEGTSASQAGPPGASGTAGRGQESAPQHRNAVVRAASAGTLRTQDVPISAMTPLPLLAVPSTVVTLAAPSWPSATASGRTLSPTTEHVSSATMSMSMESNVTTATAQLDEVVS